MRWGEHWAFSLMPPSTTQLLADPKGRVKRGREEKEGGGGGGGSPRPVAQTKIEAMVLNAADANRDRWGSTLFLN